MDSPGTPEALLESSPVFRMSSNKLQILGDTSWPEPVIVDAESIRNDKKARRRIRKDTLEIGRDNLLTIFKLVCKELMDSSLVHGRLLDDEFVPLQQLFVVLEHILMFGLKGRRLGLINLAGGYKDVYSMLELILKLQPESSTIFNTIKDSSHIKTAVGRVRAFIRLAMMQKKLYDYFKILLDEKQIIQDYYESGAVLIDEEQSLMLIGLLVGLNCIDCHVTIKEDRHLDEAASTIDYSLYLSEASLPGPEIDASETDSGTSDLTTALDQAKFLEEHNTRLTQANSELKTKLNTIQTELDELKSLKSTTDRMIEDLKSENTVYRLEASRVASDLDSRLQMSQTDAQIDQQAYKSTREGLETLYSEADRRLKDEVRLRHEAETEVKLQIDMKTELEMATRLLEKDVHEKQDIMIALRNQLDDVKGYNIEAHSKLQLTEVKLNEKTKDLNKSEQTVQLIRKENDKLNTRMKELNTRLKTADESRQTLESALRDEKSARVSLETDLKIEKEWRSAVQDNLTQSEEKINQLTNQLKRLSSIENDYKNLKGKHEELRKRFEEQESALEDMAAQLGSSKLKQEDLREVQQAFKDAYWADDDQVTNCKQCDKIFNLARRKHHCRHCGHIFCNECSDQKMMLPSSAKAVRVCDSCNVILLDRASKTT